MSSSDLGQEVYESNLQAQTTKCEEVAINVQNLILQEGMTDEKLDFVGSIREELTEMEESTKELFDNPDRINDVNRHIRRILLDIAEYFDYDQKIYDNRNNLKDDISTLFHWFKLVVKLHLGSDCREVEHEYAIHECRRKRNDREHGPSGESLRPDIIGIGVLTWYALHEILWNWKAAQNIAIHGTTNRAEADDEHKYGFIYKINKKDSQGADHSITQYSEGESGDKIAFEKGDLDFLPSKGDVVMFNKTERDGAPVASNITKIE